MDADAIKIAVGAVVAGIGLGVGWIVDRWRRRPAELPAEQPSGVHRVPTTGQLRAVVTDEDIMESIRALDDAVHRLARMQDETIRQVARLASDHTTIALLGESVSQLQRGTELTGALVRQHADRSAEQRRTLIDQLSDVAHRVSQLTESEQATSELVRQLAAALEPEDQ